MAQLEILLFGPPRFIRDGQPLKTRGRKLVALAAYLAVTGQAHSRDALAALFWPDYDSAGAKANLRRELSRLNALLGADQLTIDRDQVAVAPEADFRLDVARFQATVAACRDHGHPPDEPCPRCLPLLNEAVALYTDDLLAGFTLADAPDFDEWHFFQAEGLRRALATVLTCLARGYTAQGDFAAAIPHARRLLTLDPLHEPAHQQLMQLYAWAGQDAAALRQYEECARLLQSELGAAPAAATTDLYAQLKRGAAAGSPAQPANGAAPPTDRYAAQAEIGRGGFSIVYRGWDSLLQRPVALKVLRARLAADGKWPQRFHREARIIAQLDHPSIVPVYDVQETGEGLSIVMRLVDGVGLDVALRDEGPLPWSRAVALLRALADGLDYAHGQGILHRDLKPANILLDRERGPQLSDFGLATLIDQSTLNQEIVGTPHYIAPELWHGRPPTPQSDLYALGCILYEVLTGAKLFAGERPPP